MNLKRSMGGVFLALAFSSAMAHAQTTQITTEYLMTLYAPLDPPQQIDASLLVYNVRDGGWVKGSKVNGTLLSPAADWLRVMPGGNLRLDVRGTLKTDDGALVYITYNGVISQPKEASDRFANGDALTSKDVYFITAPTMQTASEKYAWLNHVQCVGKVVEVKGGPERVREVRHIHRALSVTVTQDLEENKRTATAFYDEYFERMAREYVPDKAANPNTMF